MKIRLTSIGGFAGPAAPAVHELDSTQMPQAQVEQLQALLLAAQFDSLPTELLKTAPKSWDFVHEISVQECALMGAVGSKAVRFHEDAASAGLLALFEFIQQNSGEFEKT